MIPRMGPPQTDMMSTKSKSDNPLHLSFRNPLFPANLITSENALEYFCNTSNTFYDIQSNNQTLRMQNISRPIEECLLSMPGIQYSLWHSQAPLFIICKQIRNSAVNVTPLAYYYIINGNIHQAPDMYSIIQSRLLGTLEPLRHAFQEVTNYSRFNTAKGYHWEFKGKHTKKNDEEKKEEEKTTEERSTNFQKTRTLMLLHQLLEEMPADQAIEPAEEDKKKKQTGNVVDTEAPTTSGAGPSTPAKTAEPVFAEPTGRVAKQQ